MAGRLTVEMRAERDRQIGMKLCEGASARETAEALKDSEVFRGLTLLSIERDVIAFRKRVNGLGRKVKAAGKSTFDKFIENSGIQVPLYATEEVSRLIRIVRNGWQAMEDRIEVLQRDLASHLEHQCPDVSVLRETIADMKEAALEKDKVIARLSRRLEILPTLTHRPITADHLALSTTKFD